MNTSETITEIAQALAKAQAEFRPVAKSGKNHEFRYTYADLDDYFASVRPALAKHGLSLATSVLDVETLPERKTARGSTMYGARVRVVTRLIHTSGQWIEAEAYGEALDTTDKAVFKATTGARKYALASLLGLATTDDPERDQEPQGQSEASPRSEAAAPPADQEDPAAVSTPVRGSARTALAAEGQRACMLALAANQHLPEKTSTWLQKNANANDLTAEKASKAIREAEEYIREKLAHEELATKEQRAALMRYAEGTALPKTVRDLCQRKAKDKHLTASDAAECITRYADDAANEEPNWMKGDQT